jgi:hypothetical protein
MASGCVTGAPANGGSADGASQRAERAAFASSGRGDNWIATNQFERAQAGYDSPRNRFNLAAAYESTGRPLEAAALYRTVLVDGRFTTIVISRPNVGGRGADSKVNLADEARRRLAIIDARLGELAPPDHVPGASASAFIGGPSSGRVTDSEALRLDEEARNSNEE